jgi:hypothetical protein
MQNRHFTVTFLATMLFAALSIKPAGLAIGVEPAPPAKEVSRPTASVPSGSRQSPLRKLKESKAANPIARQQPIASKVVRYAETLIRRYDTDGDGQLSEPEWASLGESLRVSDLDRDGFITADEFARRIMAYGRRRSLHFVPLASSPLGVSGAPVGSRNEQKSADASVRVADGTVPSGAERDATNVAKRYFVPATRLPTGLADWFLESDADGDGQVTTAELAKGASAETITQFSALDTNGDGVITASESLAGQKTSSGSPNTVVGEQPSGATAPGTTNPAPVSAVPR